jgi:RNA-directed DNA polymerase
MSLELGTEVHTEMYRSQLREYRTESERVSEDVSNYSSSQESQLSVKDNLIEKVIETQNLKEAYKRVYANKGAPGIDKVEYYELYSYVQENWPTIRKAILEGSYTPSVVLRVEIPKPQGGVRPLGIPTLKDRLIQQAIHQVLSPLYERIFSDSSYGFRPKRSAHDAIKQAKKYQEQGYKIVVDMDLKSFFDEVNHDLLMGLLRRKVKDPLLLKLIRSYLQAGIMANGICSNPSKGTPQGGPLSPLLSNIILHELDVELEKRGHKFCRYADDCNIYVKTKRSGDRVFASIANFVEKKLKLKVNWDKSAVDYPARRKFLGFSFNYRGAIRISKEAKQRFRQRVKELCRMGKGRNLQDFIENKLNLYLRGWFNYYRIADEKKRFVREADEWIRHRLRCILWRQWKRPWTRCKNLMKLGLDEERAVRSAFNKRGPWWNSGKSHMNQALKISHFQDMGLYSLHDQCLIAD